MISLACIAPTCATLRSLPDRRSLFTLSSYPTAHDRRMVPPLSQVDFSRVLRSCRHGRSAVDGIVDGETRSHAPISPTTRRFRLGIPKTQPRRRTTSVLGNVRRIELELWPNLQKGVPPRADITDFASCLANKDPRLQALSMSKCNVVERFSDLEGPKLLPISALHRAFRNVLRPRDRRHSNALSVR